MAVSLAVLREKHLRHGAPLPPGLLAKLKTDPRAGAQALVKALETRASANRSEGQRLRKMLAHETALWSEGHLHIAGVDEAGMGPCAGPVVAAAAILPRGYKLRGLDDSKKILDQSRREALAEAIKRDAVAWAAGWASVEEIDTLNIYQAGLLAMRRAVEGLAVVAHFCLVDARKIPGLSQPQKGLIHGDALSLSIAAASVIAKTTRDRHMVELDVQYPGYGLAVHKGYPTPDHLEALQRLGACEAHRKSYAPVQRAMGLLPTQIDLFA